MVVEKLKYVLYNILYSSISAQGDSNVSSNIKLPTDNRIQTLKEFEFDDLEKATRNFHPDMLLGKGGLGRVFLGWIDQYTFTPTEDGVGVAVAVKKMHLFNYKLWQVSFTKCASTYTYNEDMITNSTKKNLFIDVLYFYCSLTK